MVLRLKDRKGNPRKKILIYGLDGTGKSTFAEKYCKENRLNPIVIDVDDTNYTSLDILDLKFANDLQTYTIVKNSIKEIGKSDYDTLVLDGVSSLLEMLTSKAKGQAKYSDRSMRWNDILFEIENTRKNIIFIGQIDCDMLWTDDYQPSKAIIKLNSLVNEKYYCFVDKDGNYLQEVKKMRTLEQLEAEAKPQQIEDVPADAGTGSLMNIFDNAEEIASSIIAELQDKTMLGAKIELAKLVKEGIVDGRECPRILAELEKQL